MWVTPYARGLNIGITLVKAFVAHAFSKDYASVVLHVSVDNTQAYRLYEKSGFVVVDEPLTLNSHNDINLQKWYGIIHNAPTNVQTYNNNVALGI